MTTLTKETTDWDDIQQFISHASGHLGFATQFAERQDSEKTKRQIEDAIGWLELAKDEIMPEE